jgi:nucleoside-diphosphate-sugar epimerase
LRLAGDRREQVNLGSGREIVIKDLVQMIAELSGFDGDVRWQTDKPDGQPRRWLDTERALKKFGFQSKTSLEVGLKKLFSGLNRNFSLVTLEPCYLFVGRAYFWQSP